jgi:hypothetical protein
MGHERICCEVMVINACGQEELCQGTDKTSYRACSRVPIDFTRISKAIIRTRELDSPEEQQFKYSLPFGEQLLEHVEKKKKKENLEAAIDVIPSSMWKLQQLW